VPFRPIFHIPTVANTSKNLVSHPASPSDLSSIFQQSSIPTKILYRTLRGLQTYLPYPNSRQYQQKFCNAPCVAFRPIFHIPTVANTNKNLVSHPAWPFRPIFHISTVANTNKNLVSPPASPSESIFHISTVANTNKNLVSHPACLSESIFHISTVAIPTRIMYRDLCYEVRRHHLACQCILSSSVLNKRIMLVYVPLRMTNSESVH